MKEIKKQIDDLSAKITQVEDERYKEMFSSILDVLEGLSTKVQEILVNETVLAENFKYMDDDISNLQEELFQEVSLEELDEIEEEFKEVNCRHCGKAIFIETSALVENDKIQCPYCNENII